METLEDEHSKKTKTGKVLTQTEIHEEICSRLPVKSILRFKTICKEWGSLISDPRFTKLQFSRATASHRAALLLFAYDTFARRRYFLSAAPDGGSVTHLTTLDNRINDGVSLVLGCLNGLACLTSRSFSGSNYAMVLNPSTRKFFELPDPVPLSMYWQGWDIHYFFGFDESTSDYKVLHIKVPGCFIDFQDFEPQVCEFMIFSLSLNSWRKMDVAFPHEVTKERWHYPRKQGVCVNSAIHLLLGKPLEILVFDLRTEKFSFVQMHPDAGPQNAYPPCLPFLIEVNGLLGVVCPDDGNKTNKMDIWILQDYENCVWVKETVIFPESWSELGYPRPLASGSTDEIIFSPRKLSENLIGVLIYNIKSRCFNSVKLSIDHPFLRSEDVEFGPITRYVESLVSCGDLIQLP